ncbi:hypothetical protein [Desulfovibrio inopinatus]|uniref:hypothetical protein n=1 Tax=Desulfovibrio inopinatus TaxID=102109 RepID=UPI00041081AD|nr:hypothetical protein [Desulfovibrio inopinatus]
MEVSMKGTRLVRSFFFLALFAATMLPTAVLGQTTTWTTNGYKVLKNGTPFFMKGVDYAPVPIGAVPDNSPYGDYFTPNQAAFFNRDIPAMRDMGVNCIRLYAGSPANSANYGDFLNALYNGGDRPIYVIMTSFINAGDMLNASAVAGYVNDYTTMAQNLKNYPAVMGFSIGNELNSGGSIDSPDFWANMDKIAAAVRTNAPDKLTIVAMVDDGNDTLKAGIGKIPHIMCWGLNVYRGPDWGGTGNNIFTQYGQLTASDVKPLIITEYGTPASTRQNPGGESTDIILLPNNAQAQGDFLVTQWQGMAANADSSTQVSCGGMIFDWVDEWWKAGNPSLHDPGPNNAYQGGAFAGGYWDEEWFGINGVTTGSPGTLEPRAAITSLKTEWSKTSHDGSEIYGNTTAAIAGSVSAINSVVIEEE